MCFCPVTSLWQPTEEAPVILVSFKDGEASRGRDGLEDVGEQKQRMGHQ